MREFYKKFKKLTGLNYQDIANKVGVSKQHIHASMGNHSFLNKTSMVAVLNYCIDDKIEDHEKHISELKGFKKELMQQALKIKE